MQEGVKIDNVYTNGKGIKGSDPMICGASYFKTRTRLN
jgi:hypothetical protein